MKPTYEMENLEQNSENQEKKIIKKYNKTKLVKLKLLKTEDAAVNVVSFLCCKFCLLY